MFEMKATFLLFIIVSSFITREVVCSSNGPVVNYSNTVTEVLTFGPFTVQSGQMFSTSDFLPLQISESGYGLVGFTIKLIGVSGNVVDQDYAYLHHFEVVDALLTDVACPESKSNIVVAAGADLGNIYIQMPYYISIPAQPMSRWQYNLDIMNPNSYEITVSVETSFSYVKVDSSNKEVFGSMISVAGCNQYAFDVEGTGENNSTYYRYLTFESTFTGKMVWATGHLHRGGKDVYLLDKESGEVMANTLSHYQDPSNPTWITFIDIVYPYVDISMNQSLIVGCVYNSSVEIKGAMCTLLSYNIVDNLFLGDQTNRETAHIGLPVEKSSWSVLSVIVILVFSAGCFVAGLSVVLIALFSYYMYHKSKERRPKFSSLSDEMDGMDDITMF